MAKLIGTGNNQVSTNGMLGGMAFQSPEDVQVDKLQEQRYNVVTQQDIGTAPNQVPINGFLGSLAFLDSIQGIDFSPSTSTGTATSNILDDYEEGTWTPAAFLSYNPAGTKSVSTGGGPTGQYVKVGKVVTAWFYLSYTLSGTGGYNMGVNGLPFTTDNVLSPVCGGARESSATGYWHTCESVTGTTIQVLRRYDNGSPYDGTGSFYGFVTYRAA